MLATSVVLFGGSGPSQAQSDADVLKSFEGRFRGKPTPPIFTRPETEAVLPNVISPPEDAPAAATPATSPAQVMPHHEDASTPVAARPPSLLKKLIAPPAEAAAEPPAAQQGDIHLHAPEPAPVAEVAAGAAGQPPTPRQAEIELPPPEPARPAVIEQNERLTVARPGKHASVGVRRHGMSIQVEQRVARPTTRMA
jgi:hypothetical protein